MGRRSAVSAFVVALACAALVPAAAAATRASRVSRTLPPALRLVDRSRSIRLPHGRRVPRPLTTLMWYPPAGSGPWPLVVFGHGFAGTPVVYRRLLRAWADAGYLVAAPLFPLGNADAPGGPDRSDLVHQPRDMRFVITQLLAANSSAESPLYGLVDARHIAVAGQSDGGITAFATAYERGYADPRVDAAIVMAGARLDDGPLEKGPPLLAIQGSDDRVNDPRDTLALFDAVTRPKFLLWLRGAGHLPPFTTPSRGLAAVERATRAFLDHYLRGRPLRALSRATAGLGIASLQSDP